MGILSSLMHKSKKKEIQKKIKEFRAWPAEKKGEALLLAYVTRSLNLTPSNEVAPIRVFHYGKGAVAPLTNIIEQSLRNGHAKRLLGQ